MVTAWSLERSPFRSGAPVFAGELAHLLCLLVQTVYFLFFDTDMPIIVLMSTSGMPVVSVL